MTAAELIESGLIECYVLGSATPEEIREVERHLAASSEVREALQEVEAALLNYAEQHAVTPNPALRDQIIAAVLQSSPTSTDSGKVIALQADTSATSSTKWRGYAAAAAVLLLLSVGGNIWLWSQGQKTNERIAALEQEKTKLTEAQQASTTQLAAIQDSMQILQHDRNMAFNAQVKSVLLKSLQAENPESEVLAHWDTQNHTCCLHTKNLPEAPAGKQYQLWAIVDGKPVDAGIMPVDNSMSVHSLNTIDHASAFAITLEKTGGVVNPEGPMVAKGEIASL